MVDPGWLYGSKEIKDCTQLGKVLLKTAVFQLRATEGRELERAPLPLLQEEKKARERAN